MFREIKGFFDLKPEDKTFCIYWIIEYNAICKLEVNQFDKEWRFIFLFCSIAKIIITSHYRLIIRLLRYLLFVSCLKSSVKDLVLP